MLETATPPTQFSPYDELKRSLELANTETDIMDTWFRGIIMSLYYRPNHTVLVLEGDTVQCSRFLQELFPQKEMFACIFSKGDKDEIYNRLVINTGFFKNTLNIASQDNFIVKDGSPYPYAEKRMASYCTTEPKWTYPDRKNFLVLKVSWIVWSRYEAINKLALWTDIFNRFKPY